VGPVGGKGRPSVEKVGEWYVKSWCLQGCSPRLCQLRTNGLTPASKYWTYRSHVSVMGTVSLVAGYQQKLVFSPTASLVVVRAKLGMDPRIIQSSTCGLCRETFSWPIDLYKSVDNFAKGCYALTVWDTYGLGPYVEWVFDACGVLIWFFPIGCTSIWIIATLGYEYRLFAAVIM
jgi:hypothetical protein